MIAFVGAKFIAPFFDNSNTTVDTTKPGVMNVAPTRITAGAMNHAPTDRHGISYDINSPTLSLIEQILAAKKEDPRADTSALEKQIDEMVYALYGLTPEEIAIVEGKG